MPKGITAKTHKIKTSPYNATQKNYTRFKNLASIAITKKKENHPHELLTGWMPHQVKTYIWGNKLNKDMRKYIEPVGANDQCERAGVSFNVSTTTCWLCGCVIGKQAKACEHILPALRAVMLTGMISTNEIMERKEFKESNIELLNEITVGNYLWAHSNCNGGAAKSGLVLLKVENNRFVPDKPKCNELTAKISNIRRQDCYKIHNADKRYTSIYDRLEKEMIKQINKN